MTMSEFIFNSVSRSEWQVYQSCVVCGLRQNLQNILSVAAEPVIAPAQLGHLMNTASSVPCDATRRENLLLLPVGADEYPYQSRQALVWQSAKTVALPSHGWAQDVLTASVHEPFLVGDAFVRYFEERFHMWYIFGQKWKQFPDSPNLERVCRLGVASEDVLLGSGSGYKSSRMH